jgi:hypothetical protein
MKVTLVTEGYALGTYGNGVLRKIFGLEMENMTGG